MKRHSLRMLACSLVAVLAVTCGLVLTACGGPSAEDAIRQDLTTNLDLIKNLDDNTIDELVADADLSTLETYGLDAREVVSSLVDGFDYSVGDISVDGDTAAVGLTVTSKHLVSSALDYDAITADAATAILSGELDPNDTDAVNAWIGQYIMGLIDAIEPTETTLDLTYAKTDGTWSVDQASANLLSQIFL